MKLRELEINDAIHMFEWMKDETINRFFRFKADSVTLEDVEKFIQNASLCKNDKHYAIVDDENIYLGTISLKNIDVVNMHAEYAIALRNLAIGTGIAQKATAEIISKAFNELNLHKVYLNVPTENKRAIKFYEKSGFKFEGEFRDHLFIDSKYYNLKWYSITNNDL